MYLKVDRVLWQQTRFFGAAALTMNMIADIDLPVLGGVSGLSAGSRDFLSDLSAGLQKKNEDLAKLIENGVLKGGSDLDKYMVKQEQNYAQMKLGALKAASPSNYNEIIREMNALLNTSGFAAFGSRVYPSDARYQKLLDQVRKTLGRNIDYANQDDREEIGNALIDAIRHGQFEY